MRLTRAWKDTNVLLNHQLNSSPIFAERAFPAEKTALLLSIFCRSGEKALWAAPFLEGLLGERPDLAGRVALHLPAPASVSPRAVSAFSSLARSQEEGALLLWSGGWSGAPGAFLSRRELEGELEPEPRTGGASGPETAGLAALFPLPPRVFFLRGLTPLQVEDLGRERGALFCGGYRQRPLQGEVAPLWFFGDSRWTWRPSLVLDPGRPLPAPLGPVPGGSSPPLVHLVLGPGDLPRSASDPARALQAVLHLPEAVLPSPGAVPTEEPRRDEPASGQEPPRAGLLPSFFADPLPLSGQADLFLAAGTAAFWRGWSSQTPGNPEKVLLSLSPYGESPRPPARRTPIARKHLPPGDFQSTTEGHLMMEEDSLTFRFASGRLAGITWNAPTSTPPLTTVPRRAQGFCLEQAGRTPTVTYLQTRHAAWFSGETARGVEEVARMDLGGTSLEFHTSAALRTGKPGLSLSFLASFPETLPAGPCSISLFQIPLVYLPGNHRVGPSPEGSRNRRPRSDRNPAPETAFQVEAVSPEGESLAVNLSSNPGRTTLVAWFLRVPLSRDESLLIGAAEPGQKIATAFEIEIVRTTRGALLTVDPIFRHQGQLPRNLAGTGLAGTLLFARGDTPLEQLVIPPDEKTPLYRFSRTVPE